MPETSTPEECRISIWLMPASPNLEALQQIINQLAQDFTPDPHYTSFQPHLTLWSAPFTNAGQFQITLDKLHHGNQLSSFNPLTLKVVQIAADPRRFKSIHFVFDPAPLLPLSQHFGKILQGNFDFQPHLTLYYQDNFDPGLQQQIIADLTPQWLGKSITFDQIASVHHLSPHELVDVDSWPATYHTLS